MNVNEKVTEHHETTDHATSKQLLYTDKERKEDETDSKIAPINQKTQAREAVTQDNTTFFKNEQKQSIKGNGNGRWCDQEKMNNKQNSVVQKMDAYSDIIKKIYKKFNTREGSYRSYVKKLSKITRHSTSHSKNKN